MDKIGCHLSCSKGFLHMGKEAVSIGATTFQFFTRNPRGSKAKALDPEDVRAYLAYAAKHGIEKIVAHAPYTLNPCAAKKETRAFALETMADDLERLESLPGAYYNFHPGSHVGQGIPAGIREIAGTLNEILRPGQGYDIREHLEETLDSFDRVIGLDRLKAVHVNDTKNPMGSHKDRHEKIGEGFLGLEALRRVVHHPKLAGLPFCLETPNELSGYEAEIRLLREKS